MCAWWQFLAGRRVCFGEWKAVRGGVAAVDPAGPWLLGFGLCAAQGAGIAMVWAGGCASAEGLQCFRSGLRRPGEFPL